MSIGIQYDLYTGVISGTCQPAPENPQLPAGRAQLVVPDGTEINAFTMKVDVDNLVLVEIPVVVTDASLPE